MKLRQIDRKWILLGVAALLLCSLVILPRLAGSSSFLAKRASETLATWTGGEVKLTGPLRVQYFPDVAIRTGVEFTHAPNLPLVKSIAAKDARISLDLVALVLGRIRVDAVRLTAPEIALKEAPSLVMGPEQTLQARVTNLLNRAPFRVLRVRKGAIVMPTASGGETIDKLDARFELSSGTLAGYGSFVLRHEPVNFTLDTGSPSETGDGLSVPVTLSFSAPTMDATVAGTASFANEFQLDGDMKAGMTDARAFLRWAGIELAEGRSLKAFSASGAARWNGTTLTFDDGAFALDGNAAVGALAVTPGIRPRIDGTLAFDRLALDPYIGAENPSDGAAPARPDQSALNHFDTDLRISAAEITAPGLQLGRGGFNISARKGLVSSDVSEVEFCGGTVTGRIDVDLSQAVNKAKLAGKLSDIPIENCLGPLGLHVPLNGTSNLKVDFATTGSTYGELARGLAGPFGLKARRGAISVDLTRLFAGSGALQGEGWSMENATSFDELIGECRLGAGQISCEKFNMKTDQGLISGSGDIDLGQQTLNWRLFVADRAAPLNDSQLAAQTPLQVSISGALAQPVIVMAGQEPVHSGSVPTAARSTQVSPR
ncbi:MAG TPA: AsmA-like C-terminal region-containing protein [Methyloceanibacter sp.]|nr:AsmA-like C-terminal region-containing protein [Methyloceanibacter sp.]